VHALPNQDKRAGMTNKKGLDKLLELAKMVKRESRKVENLKQVYITWVRVPWERCNVSKLPLRACARRHCTAHRAQ
jgi:hypothetical protein